MADAELTGSRLDAALEYLAFGWAVIPAAERSKRPIVKWRGLQETAPTEENVRTWFDRWPNANLSVVTGAISGIVVLDVDIEHDGAKSLSALENRHGLLPKTVESITGSGGRQ